MAELMDNKLYTQDINFQALLHVNVCILKMCSIITSVHCACGEDDFFLLAFLYINTLLL